jgi:hypothetical protein
VLAGELHRLAADESLQLAEGDHRAGAGDGADDNSGGEFTHEDGVEGIGGRLVEEGADGHQHRGHADEAMQGRHQLGHGGHLDAHGQDGANEGARHHAGDDETVGLDLRAHQGGDDGDGHADHAIEVAAPGRGGMGQPLEGQDE